MQSFQKRLIVVFVLLTFIPLTFVSKGKTLLPGNTDQPVEAISISPTVNPTGRSIDNQPETSISEVDPDEKPGLTPSAPPISKAIPDTKIQETHSATYRPITEPENIEIPSQSVPEKVIVQFARDSSEEERQAYIDSIEGTVVESIDSIDTVVVSVSADTAKEPLPVSVVVEQSEPDYFVSALENAVSVNDPLYTEQWALPAIGAPSAWVNLPLDAPKITVAVIDSGICADHPDLTGRILEGWDFIESDAVPQDDFGHGCSVAGIIAANMNDGIGIAGLAPNAQIMPLRVLNSSGIGFYSDVAAAIIYAADHGVKVINLSLGGINSSSTLESAVRYATDKGVILIAAAGNNGMDGVLYPAAYSGVIAVGSLDPNLQPSSFSNFGTQVDTWAPGRDILTTKRDGSYSLASGTSFAAPYMAGAEAIALSEDRLIELGGSVLSIAREPIISPTITATPNATPQPTATPTETSSTQRLVLDFSGRVYAFSLKTGDFIFLGETSPTSVAEYPVSDTDVFEITKAPINNLNDDYGFYHGIWSKDKEKFAYLSLQSLTVNQVLTIWAKNGISQELVNLSGDESIEYYDPIAWKGESTLVLMGRKVLGLLDGKITIYEKNINDIEAPKQVNSFSVPYLSGKSFSLDDQSVFLGIESISNVAYILNIQDYTLQKVALQADKDFQVPEDGIAVKSLGYVSEDKLQEFFETTASFITATGVTNLANRPSAFIYWPLDDYWRVRTSTGGEVLNYVWDSPWREALNKPSYIVDGRGHQGTDIGLNVGIPLYASGSGTGRVAVLYMGCPDLSTSVDNFDGHVKNCVNEPRRGSSLGYFNAGNVIILEYSVTVAGQAKNIYLVYGHLKQESQPLGIYQGATVNRGTHIAGSGHNGVSSIPHLHFDVRYSASDPNYNTWDDPWGDADLPHTEPDPGTMWVYNFSNKPIAAYPGSDRTGSVGGIVRNGSGQPVSGVSVSAKSGGTSATTDGSGYYTLQNVPEGSTTIVARHNTGDAQTTVTVIAFASVQANMTLAPVCLASIDDLNPLCYVPPTNDTTPPTGYSLTPQCITPL